MRVSIFVIRFLVRLLFLFILIVFVYVGYLNAIRENVLG